ncbi:hypothetical protein L7F22_010042, partial [Adiantum nelumboides]|nr:hypothetical protein [Adiantum nelumboides]
MALQDALLNGIAPVSPPKSSPSASRLKGLSSPCHQQVGLGGLSSAPFQSTGVLRNAPGPGDLNFESFDTGPMGSPKHFPLLNAGQGSSFADATRGMNARFNNPLYKGPDFPEQ